VAGFGNLTLTGDWQKLQYVMKPGRFGAAVDREMRRATRTNAMFVAREMRQRVKGRRFEANAALTITLKHSDLPLVDHGTSLFQAIGHTMITPDVALAGIVKAAEGRAGHPSPYDIGLTLHEGAAIKVTPAMRGLFGMLARFTQGEVDAERLTGRAAEIAERLRPGRDVVHPLKATTESIVIPPRPFLRDVAEDPSVRKECQQRWEEAYGRALLGEVGR
jgi:hypothetical protein